MSWWAFAAQAAMDLANLSEGKKADSKNRKFQWKMMQEQLAYQREFAQQGLRWRVEDAKAAGLHPLSALGAQGLPAYSPVSADSSPAATSASLARGWKAPFQTSAEKAAQMAALAESASRASANDAEAGYYRAMEAKIRQDGASQTVFPVVNKGEISPEEIVGSTNMRVAEAIPAVRYIPEKDNAGSAAGATPLWRTFHLTTTRHGQDVPIALPGGMTGDAAEVLESLAESPVLMAMVMKENTRRYGPSWGRWFAEHYLPGVRKRDRGYKFRSQRDLERYKKSYVPYEGY